MKKKIIIREGFCGCGCGKKTNVYTQNCKRKNHVKGQPAKFLAGHNIKIWNKIKNNGHSAFYKDGTYKFRGYILVLVKNHPRSRSTPYIFEHILVAEKALGKYLTKTASVHHVNGNKSDNRNENLVVCENEQYHQLLHARMRALKNSGNPNQRCCRFCKKYDDIKNLNHNEKARYHQHLSCYAAYQRDHAKGKLL